MSGGSRTDLTIRAPSRDPLAATHRTLLSRNGSARIAQLVESLESPYRRSTGLVDILDRVLDKGLVVAGDIRISLADVELLTIRIRLLVCSIDKAEQIGLDWWRHDPHLTVGARGVALENQALRAELETVRGQLARLTPAVVRRAPAPRRVRPPRTKR